MCLHYLVGWVKFSNMKKRNSDNDNILKEQEKFGTNIINSNRINKHD
jgi:hypothetical protein